MVRSGNQVIPTSPIKSTENIVNSGVPLYRINIKVKALDSSNKPVANATIMASTTSTGVVKGINTSGRTNSSGEGYIYVDIRGVAQFNITAKVNTVQKISNFNTVESCDYQSTFYTTGYITALESDYTKAKTTATGISGKTFKADFLSAVMLNGSGEADGKVKILYNATTKKYSIGEPKTSSGTTPVVNRTIAVDNYYIPRYKMSGSTYKRGQVNINGIGTRIAEDAGGAINKYDIDVYMGIGKKSMIGFGTAQRKVTYIKSITS